VDDVETNLYIAKGMMLPYGLKIETVSSGIEAVEKIKNGNEYSVVFMDYMMPKMNGLEATKVIREMGYTNPIIVLTANAVMGSSEMFLSNGFDGYISKPIDLRELNAQLNRFIRDKQPPEVIESARQQRLNETPVVTDRKTQMEADFASTVVRNIKNSINILEGIYEIIPSHTDADINLYTITVHGMHGALANIGETVIAETAGVLEQAGYEKDMDVITSQTPAFINALKLLAVKYQPEETAVSDDTSNDDTALLTDKLGEIKEACVVYDIDKAEAVLNALRSNKWSRSVTEFLGGISENLLCGKVKEVVAVIEGYVK
jgi:CheY-like chemotaxis protein